MYPALTDCAASNGRGKSIVVFVVVLFVVVWLAGWKVEIGYRNPTRRVPDSFAGCCTLGSESNDMLFM